MKAIEPPTISSELPSGLRQALNDFFIDLVGLVNRAAAAGRVVGYVGAAAPDGWLLCDGATYEAAEYPELAAILNPGGADFTVPDLTSESLGSITVWIIST